MDLSKRLEAHALGASVPYCVQCDVKAPRGACPCCSETKLARLLPGVGVDWDLDWIIRHLLATHLTAVDTEAAFVAAVAQTHGPTVTVAWLDLDVIQTLRAGGLSAWEQAKREWLYAEEEAGRLLTFDSAATYYAAADIETYLARAKTSAAVTKRTRRRARKPSRPRRA